MVKRQSINFFLLVYCISILCLACSSPQQSVTIQEKSATEYVSDISYDDEGFAEERLESEMIATLPDDAEYVCIGSNSNYLFLEASNKEESKDVKYYRYNLSNDNIDFLYEPQNWAYIMNPVVIGDSLILLIITDEAVQNMLPYQVIEINQASESCIIMEGVSFYYPSLVVLDDGIVVEDYCLESDKMVSRILYCGKRTKSSEVLLQEEYTENGDGTITGNKISYLGRDLEDANTMGILDEHLEENNIKTFIGKNKSELFFNQLKKDVEFLCNVGSIDYSLLLGIHYINRENKTKKKKISKMKSVICKCKSNKDLAKSDINNNNNNFRRNNMLHKTKTLAAKKISMNSAIVTNGNDNFFNTYNNKLSFTDINNNNNNKINNIINNNENINNIINTNEINNNNNNENINNKSESLDEDFLSIFEDDDKSYKERLEEVHKLFNFDDGGIISENGNEIIFLGIIDILTEYNCKKSTEHFFKMIRYCSNDMSCVNPIYYKDRFFNYMKKVIMHGDPNIKNKFNKLYYQETTTDNDIKNQFISNDINNNVKGNDVDIFE